ncbi:hypothetical protein [Blastococcus aggregatus]|uniref:hypothetical protein n=1 Tax=Blastococcus aggregatus TaxID=38502 RepID=UPI003CCBF139
MRETAEFVAGQPLTPMLRAALMADFTNPLANSGSVGLAFINVDVTMYLVRDPRGGVDRHGERRPPRCRRHRLRHHVDVRPGTAGSGTAWPPHCPTRGSSAATPGLRPATAADRAAVPGPVVIRVAASTGTC